MSSHSISYNQIAVVDLKDEAFTPEFLKEFSEYMYPFKRKEEHAEHIGQLFIRGLHDSMTDFVEGYGVISEFVNSVKLLPADVETNR